MNLDELEAACDAAETAPYRLSVPEVSIVVPGPAGRGARKKVAQALFGLLVNERQLADGSFECTVAVKVKDLRGYIRRGRYRAAFHGGGSE